MGSTASLMLMQAREQAQAGAIKPKRARGRPKKIIATTLLYSKPKPKGRGRPLGNVKYTTAYLSWVRSRIDERKAAAASIGNRLSSPAALKADISEYFLAQGWSRWRIKSHASKLSSRLLRALSRAKKRDI